MYKNIHVDKDAAGIVALTVDRPAARNAISTDTMREINDAIDALEHDKSVRALIISGAGDEMFVSGGDLKEFRTFESPEDGRRMARTMTDVLNRIDALEIPVIAAVNGGAYGGGCEIAVTCDIRVASDRAKLGYRQVKMGIMPGWGGGQRLARLLGQGRALNLMLTGDVLDAHEALRIGLVDQVVPHAEVRTAARELAEKIAANPVLSVRHIKRSVKSGLAMPLRDAIENDLDLFTFLWGTDDHHEAEAAFIEKRAPVFKRPEDVL